MKILPFWQYLLIWDNILSIQTHDLFSSHIFRKDFQQTIQIFIYKQNMFVLMS